MEYETEAIESGIGTDHDSVQAEEMMSTFIGRMNDQLRSWYGDGTTTVYGCAVACSAGTETVANSDGSHTDSSYAGISFTLLLKRLKMIFDTEALGAVPVDTHGSAADSGSDQTFLVEASHTNNPREITIGDHGSFSCAFRQTQNVSDVQQGVVSSITNRSNKDSDRYSIDATDESQKRGEYLTTTLHNTTGD